MKKLMLFLCFLILTTNAYASLEVIGTATYEGEDYKLIYMDNGPFGPITWLDYTNKTTNTTENNFYTWAEQLAWANGLGAELLVTLNEGYITSADWSVGWRLPETVDRRDIGGNGPWDGAYHITTSEMSYLFYEELENKGAYDIDGNTQSNHGLLFTGDFDHLTDYSYWSGTEYSGDTGNAWRFYFGLGALYYWDKDGLDVGLAVFPGEVSRVPLPGAFLMLGSGIAGLGAIRKFAKRRFR